MTPSEKLGTKNNVSNFYLLLTHVISGHIPEKLGWECAVTFVFPCCPCHLLVIKSGPICMDIPHGACKESRCLSATYYEAKSIAQCAPSHDYERHSIKTLNDVPFDGGL